MKYNLAILLLRQGRLPEALPYLEAIHAEDPAQPDVLRALALTKKALQGHARTP